MEPWGEPDEVIPSGLWALPGLVDGHAHLAQETTDLRRADHDRAAAMAKKALEAGVGLILDKGWRDLTVVHLIDKVPAPERPEIEAAGVVLTVDGGFWEGFGRNVAEGEIGKAAAVAAGEGAGWVKLIGDWPRKGLGPIANFDETELEIAVTAARVHGARVAVHTMAREVPSMAVRAGVDSIEHGLFLTDDDLEMLGARGGCWVPTVVQMEATVAQLGEKSSGGRLLLEGLDNVRARLATAVEAGVHVLTGTDLAIGAHQVAQEAIRLWEMGMAAEQVIESVSRSGFRATGRPSRLRTGRSSQRRLVFGGPGFEPSRAGRSRGRHPDGSDRVMRLVLASGSPRRRELLERLGLDFDVVAPGVDETRYPEEVPAAYVERVARSKSTAVAGDGLIVVAADTIVVHEGKVMGKPGHPEEARAMLRRIEGDVHEVFTGLAIGAWDGGAHIKSVVDVAEVTMLPMTEEEIAWYVGTGEPLDKAGAYALQGLGGMFVGRVVGSPFTVIGLPIHLLARLVSASGADLTAFRNDVPG